MAHKTVKPWEERPSLSPYVVILAVLSALIGVVFFVSLCFANWDRINIFGAHKGGYFEAFSKNQPQPAEPQPRLQVEEAVDLETYKSSEFLILDSYGWMDREKQRVRIPVERAMKQLLEQGLPYKESTGG